MEPIAMQAQETLTEAHYRLNHNPYANNRRETHLEYRLFYLGTDGRTRIADGVIGWSNPENPSDLIKEILAFQTDFVRQQCQRIEVCTPNRGVYGNLKPGFIQDTGFLVAERIVEPKVVPPRRVFP